MDLQGKTAIVTGGARRVGRAIALALAERGCNLVIHHNASVDAAEQTANQIRDLAVKAVPVQADLSQYEGVRELYQEVDRAGLGIDLLVNSAAIMETVNLLSATEADWQRTIDLNLKGAFFCLQLAAQRMQEFGGVIVNISDIAGLKPWPRFPIHSISKAGIEMLTRVAALALAPKIRVNAVAPGPVLKPDGMEESRWQDITKSLPLQRGGSGEDVAQAVIYLAENSFITGETLVVDGGNQLA
ncbi:MAG: SDR family oxidoreductase [Anaerolineales bacterium]|nr:SDR family oxidoreductase [Anaerolineales bacterium]